jgi:cbb3-type cytochrome oxidase cytochrome c subunit
LLQFLRIATLTLVLLSGSASWNIIFLAASDQSTPDAGQKLYRNLSCYGCHVVNGQGGKEGPNLDGIGRQFSRRDLEIQLTTPRLRQSNSRMPSFAFLQAHELENLVVFLETLK